MNKIVVGLVGNPNCGKTTLFNQLTGSKQRVGNWPGVTVERKSGLTKYFNHTLHVIDLPGIYNIDSAGEEEAIDQRIACQYILNESPNLLINIVDASNLERNLYLTTQLLEMHIPVIVAVNMMDIAHKKNIQLDLDVLSQRLGCPVVGLCSNRGKGVEQLKQQIVNSAHHPSPPKAVVPYPTPITNAQQQLQCLLKEHQHADWLALQILAGNTFAQEKINSNIFNIYNELKCKLDLLDDEDPDIIIAEHRYRWITETMTLVMKQSTQKTLNLTALIDKIILNRVLGLPIFLLVMYVMFFFAINIGGAFQDFFDIGSNTLFVDGLSQLLTHFHTPNWLTAIIADGAGKGLNTTITFIPVIGAMFLFLAFLEASGYMARAAFVMDRLMRALGLPGKSFVPMIVGFGCNVPAIMGARTLENSRDRILTIMMTPFMSCGARFAIYAVFTAAFFPNGRQNIVFALYTIGIAMAILTGLLLRKTLLKGKPSPLILELPPYHLPTLRGILLQTWHRLKSFLLRAGKLIIPICILLGSLNSIHLGGNPNNPSLLATIGQTATPVFTPMGIQQDNWPATVGLMTGILAKEVVVGTLNTLYTQAANPHANIMPQPASIQSGLEAALASVPKNLAHLSQSIRNPIAGSAPNTELKQSVYGIMYQKFGSGTAAFAYLLFVLLYFPCISATAAMYRELSRGWTWFSALWTTGVAYCAAVSFYQLATFKQHPATSLTWISLIVISIFTTLILIKRQAQKSDHLTTTTTPIRS